MSIIYIDRKGHKRQGETGQDRLLAFIYGHCSDEVSDPSLSVTGSVPHRRGIFGYPDFRTGSSRVCKEEWH